MVTPTYWLSTLGCAKNQVDSDKVAQVLAEAGYAIATSPDAADVVMVNTCAFIEEARRESVETILDLSGVKKAGAHTVVIGCMAQRFGVDVERALPEVDAVVGLDRYGELVGIIDQMTVGPKWRPVRLRRPVMDILQAVNRPLPTMPYAYVKVAEGCDKPCTFCAIPLIRGKQRSRPASNVIAEVEALSRAGVSEVILVAQDLASYGRDRDSAENILELLQQVSAVPEVRSIRLLYLYPKEIRPALIDEVTANPKIASYFDLSLQHASTRLLRTMKRPGSAERHLELIDSIRRADQSAALRSSFIVGFPGETEEEVEELANFLEAARLDWAGFFTYSAEEGTAAASLGGRISRRETAERQRHLQGIQEEITAAANLEQVGRTYSAIVDQIEEGVPVSRSYRQAPEIDGVITLDRGRPGEWVEVEIVSALGTDLEGKVRG